MGLIAAYSIEGVPLKGIVGPGLLFPPFSLPKGFAPVLRPQMYLTTRPRAIEPLCTEWLQPTSRKNQLSL